MAVCAVPLCWHWRVQTMRIKLSEPEFLRPEESLLLRLNFTNARRYYQTNVAMTNGSFLVRAWARVNVRVQGKAH
jgi:hypothetical protein